MNLTSKDLWEVSINDENSSENDSINGSIYGIELDTDKVKLLLAPFTDTSSFKKKLTKCKKLQIDRYDHNYLPVAKYEFYNCSPDDNLTVKFESYTESKL